MTDDLYEHLIYDDNEFHTFASIAPELKENINIESELVRHML